MNLSGSHVCFVFCVVVVLMLCGCRRTGGEATLEDTAFEDATLEDTTLEDAVIEDSAFEDAAFEDAAFDDAAFDDAAFEDVGSMQPNVSMTVETNIVQIQRRVGTREIAVVTLKKTASHLIQASQPCYCLLEWQESKAEHAMWEVADRFLIGCQFYTVEADIIFHWPLGALFIVESMTDSDSIMLRFSCLDGVHNDSNPMDNVYIHGPVEIFGH